MFPWQDCAPLERHFILWALDYSEMLFLPKREPNYSLTTILDVLMARLHQSYETLMRMDEDTRDELFANEVKRIEKENEANRTK